MKAISIKQPWASLIVEGIKDIENRTWKCPEKYIGQRVLIHASAHQKLDKMPLDFILNKHQLAVLSEHYTELELCKKHNNYGVIIGSVEIVDCVINHPSIWAEKSELGQKNEPPCDFCKPIYNWVLANPIKFPKPIPAKGKLGFWDFDLHCQEFPYFGASYPDACCIDGYLWDLDSADGEFLTQGGDAPCPYCNPKGYLEYYEQDENI